MKASGIITLTSDFGFAMGYAAQMKGVILGINPNARLVDIDHLIAPQDIASAALTLQQAAPAFPAGSVHLAVVDPGVGTARRAAIVETENAYFVGPDNGLFGFLRDSGRLRTLYEIDSSRIGPPHKSVTFEGRDIFAPAAARLSLGENPLNFADLSSGEPFKPEAPENIEDPHGIEGRILCADGFGNLLTSITLAELKILQARPGCAKLQVRFRDHEIPLLKTFSDLRPAALLAYTGSGGLLEIAVNCGSAFEIFGDCRGEKLRLEIMPQGLRI